MSKEEQGRFDPMITGLNPADMYAADHIRRVLHTLRGVFSGIGEFTIHKEFVSAKVAGETASLLNPALDRILDPESTRITADLINRYPDRFLFGTDEVAPSNQAQYLRVYYQYQPLWKLLDDKARVKVLKGNYERIFNAARHDVREWEATTHALTPSVESKATDLIGQKCIYGPN